MTVRAVEGKKPYTGGIGIEITEDKVINLRLRGENNLIEYDEGDNEIYVDLQLDDEITPTDELPVGITTGRIIVDNGWEFTGTIIVAKTTSGDLIKFVYADDGKFYIDNGTGTFKQIYLKSDIDTLINALKVEIKAYVDEHDTVVSDTAPSDPYQGMLWYDTTTNKLKTYDGTQWNEIAGGATYSAGAGISIDQNNQISNSLPGPVVASSAPSNPVEGALWYDTTNDVLKSYDGTQWNTVGDDGLNVKAFYITTTGSSTTAKSQGKAALDWYLAGKTPIIIYGNKAYNLYSHNTDKTQFLSDVGYTDTNNQGYTSLYGSIFEITHLSSMVTKTATTTNSIINVIRTGHNYSISYTPPYKGSPTPREYVDDRDTYIGSSAPTSNLVEGRLWYDTTNDVLKSYDGTNWNTVGGATYVAGTGISIDTYDDYSAIQGPCDSGYHIPSEDEFNGLLNKLVNGGLNSSQISEYLRLPLCGDRKNTTSDVENQGISGKYWTRSVYNIYSSYSAYIDGSSRNVGSQYDGYGFAIRAFCNSNAPVVIGLLPVFQGIDFSIYEAQNEGEIWIHFTDTNTRTGIQDKNVGATTKWSLGDTLSQANCGYYFQRGNNYGFPFTGAVTTSPNAVSNSNQPGYSSSTFITSNSAIYFNLAPNMWGDTTGVVHVTNEINNTGVIQESVVSGDSGTTYTIKVSNTAPSAGTPDTTLTFVY